MTNNGKRYVDLVSVVTASHNSAATIENCVRSAWRQSCRPLEHIVVDDGSSDQTREILSGLAEEIPNLAVICQPNRGAGLARNAGIEAARGRYIAFLDSDDIWLEQKLEHQVSFMETRNRKFTYGDYEIVESKSGKTVGRVVPPAEIGYDELLIQCPIGCSTVAYNQEVLGKCFMPAVRRGQDWALWLALTRNGAKATKYEGCDVIYHKGESSLSSRKLAKAVDIYRIYTAQEKFGPLLSAYFLARHTLNVLTRRI